MQIGKIALETLLLVNPVGEFGLARLQALHQFRQRVDGLVELLALVAQ